MNKLIKGNLVMANVADKDVDMYVSAGWKLDNKKVAKKSKSKKLLKELSNEDEINLTDSKNEENNNSDIIKK